jgi:hypothetical protein
MHGGIPTAVNARISYIHSRLTNSEDSAAYKPPSPLPIESVPMAYSLHR